MPNRTTSYAPTKPVSYKQLMLHVRTCKSNTHRNKALLNRLRRVLERTESCDPIVDLFDEPSLRKVFASRPRTANERSAVLALRTMAQNLARIEPNLKSLVEEALRRTAVTKRTLCIDIGVPSIVLTKWRNGRAQPSCRPALEKLEVLARFEPGTLTAWIKDDSRYKKQAPFFDLSAPTRSKHRERNSLLNLGPKISDQIDMYLTFKTRRVPDVRLPSGETRVLKRKGVYTESRLAVVAGASIALIDKWAGFSSSVRNIQLIRNLYTYSAIHYGEPRDTLAIMADPQLLRAYLAYDVTRRDGYNSAHQAMVNLSSQLLRPNTGFIVQLRDLFEEEIFGIGKKADATKDAWENLCKALRYEIKQLPELLRPGVPTRFRIQQTRNKYRKLSRLLTCDNSYAQFVLPTLKRLQNERPGPDSPLEVRMTAECDILLFALISSCPIRRMNLSTLKWKENVWKEGNEWVVFVRRENLKNRLWMEGGLRLVLPKWAGDVFDYFSANVLKQLNEMCPHVSDYVLAGPTKPRRFRLDSAELFLYRNLYSRVVDLTKRTWNLAVSPHEFRTIYATDYANNHPNDILTLAAMLADKPETVLRTYAKADSTRLSRGAARNLEQLWREMEAGSNIVSDFWNLRDKFGSAQPSCDKGQVGSAQPEDVHLQSLKHENSRLRELVAGLMLEKDLLEKNTGRKT